MIIGMGSDICDIARLEATLTRFGKKFINRVFTEAEQEKATSRDGSSAKVVASTYAKRFAAKEACAKALGTGMNGGVFWHDMEVVNLPSGAPTLRLTDGALTRLKALTPEGMEAKIWLSLSDEYPIAQATVIIEAI